MKSLLFVNIAIILLLLNIFIVNCDGGRFGGGFRSSGRGGNWFSGSKTPSYSHRPSSSIPKTSNKGYPTQSYSSSKNNPTHTSHGSQTHYSNVGWNAGHQTSNTPNNGASNAAKSHNYGWSTGNTAAQSKPIHQQSHGQSNLNSGYGHSNAPNTAGYYAFCFCVFFFC